MTSELLPFVPFGQSHLVMCKTGTEHADGRNGRLARVSGNPLACRVGSLYVVFDTISIAEQTLNTDSRTTRNRFSLEAGQRH